MVIEADNLTACLSSGLQYVGITLKVAFISILIGSVLALIVALVRFYKVPVLSQIFAVFVTVYRGIPMMVILLIYRLLYVKYFDSVAEKLHLSVRINDVDIIVLGYFIITLAVIPCVSETFRGALASIDKGQFEACYSVGMSTFLSLRRVILPQMFPTAFPVYVNNIVGVIKGVPLLSALGIIEIMQGSIIPCAVNYSYIEGYTATAIIYFVLIMLVLVIAGFIEKYIGEYRVGSKVA